MAIVPLIQASASLNDPLTHGTLREDLHYFLLTCRSYKGLSARSVQDYEKKVGDFIALMEEIGVQDTKDITHRHVLVYLDTKRQTCNSISVHSYYRTIHRFFSFLIEEELLEKNPASKMKGLKMEKKTKRPLSADDVRRLLLLCDPNLFTGARDRAMILLFFDTGLRLHEMANIELNDIDDRNRIKVMGKGARERFVVFGAETEHAVARYLRMRRTRRFQSTKLWVGMTGKSLAFEGFREIFKRLKERAGFNFQLSPHIMRHSFATQCLLNGASQKEVQILLGHEDPTMTMRYQAGLDAQLALERHQDMGDGRPGFSPVDRMKVRRR